MDHPLHRKRLSRLSITEIRRAIGDYPPDAALIAKLERDPRAGVRALAQSIGNHLERNNRLEAKHEEMLAIERGLRANGSRLIAGLDEAGRGPLAGPVSVGSVILPEGIHLTGLDDSKKMSAKAREEMYDRIAAEAVAWTVVLLDHLEIDELGIHGAVMEGMRRAVERLGTSPDTALVDGRSLPGLRCRERAIVDGDALCLSIAAASVMAKVTRDRVMVEMDARYPEYGFAGHKGYGCEEHVEALRRLGPCPIHRFSFRTIAEASPQGTVRAALERRLREAPTLGDLDRAAAGIGRNGELFGGETLEYLRGVYRECREELGRKK